MPADIKIAQAIASKDILTDAEMREIIEKQPNGPVMSLPNAITIGMTDLSKAAANLVEGPKRSHHAFEHGCFLEVISLRLQYAELWLRMYWVAKKRGEIFEPSDKRTFGMIIGDCKALGFDSSLATQLLAFNAKRIEGIHKYLLGAIDYSELRGVCDEFEGLETRVQEYVCSQVGVPMKPPQEQV